MKRSRTRLAGLLTPLVFLVVVGCGVPDDDAAVSEAPVSAEAPVTPGELVDLVLANGDVTLGVAVLITQSDGTTQPAIFRGPRPLADAASEGTWTFREDALHARVRRLGPDERLRPRGG